MKNKKGEKEKNVSLHNRFVKYILGTKEAMIAFTELNLDKNILTKLDTVQVESDDFEQHWYRDKHHPDIILFVGRERGEKSYLFLLLEEKEKPNKYIGKRTLKYHFTMVFAYMRKIDKEGRFILAFVLRHKKGTNSAVESVDDIGDYVEMGLKNVFLLQLKQEENQKMEKKGRIAPT
ncbi:MAG: Rpn family recombination-promoting nuclease/putative transposase [Bacteroidota bacterium]